LHGILLLTKKKGREKRTVWGLLSHKLIDGTELWGSACRTRIGKRMCTDEPKNLFTAVIYVKKIRETVCGGTDNIARLLKRTTRSEKHWDGITDLLPVGEGVCVGRPRRRGARNN